MTWVKAGTFMQGKYDIANTLGRNATGKSWENVPVSSGAGGVVDVGAAGMACSFAGGGVGSRDNGTYVSKYLSNSSSVMSLLTEKAGE
jgi:hypothetical protein